MKMNEVDFSECSFITSEMQFIFYDDFCRNRRAIKRLFHTLSKNGKIFYKWYVYANTHTDLYSKNLIWDFLNGFDEEEEALLRLFYKSHSRCDF